MIKKSTRWRNVTTIHSFKDSSAVRVFAIARVSTDKQAKKVGESLDHQKEVLQNWVRSKSSLHAPQEWKLVEVYVENEDSDGKRKGRTATKREGRQGLAKALELARLKVIDVVVVTKLDRIARNVKDYIDISVEFNENEVALVCLDLDIDTSTPDGQMIMRNHANLAQWQAERIAQYSVETVQRHLEQGRPIGPPPVGYRKTKDANDKTTFEIDPVYKKHVLFIDKVYQREKSIYKVVDELNRKGYKSPKGNTYSFPQVSRILQNIRYTARQEHEGEIYPGNWDAIRSIETQNIIQNILNHNRSTNHSPTTSSNKYTYLGKSVLKCSKCGSSMIARPAIGRGGKYYPYYMCMKANKTNGIDCKEVNYLSAEAVDNTLVEILRHLRLEPKIVERIVSRANQLTDSTLNKLEEDLGRIQGTLKDIRTKISNLVEILADKGMAKVDAIKQKLENLNIEKDSLEVQENDIKKEIEAEKTQASTARGYIQALQLFDDFYTLNQDNKERIQALIPRFINSVQCEIIDKEKGIGKLKIGLFGRPFSRGANAEAWNETLKKIAESCSSDKLNSAVKLAVKPHKEKKSNCACTIGASNHCAENKLYVEEDKKFAQGNISDPSFFSNTSLCNYASCRGLVFTTDGTFELL